VTDINSKASSGSPLDRDNQDRNEKTSAESICWCPNSEACYFHSNPKNLGRKMRSLLFAIALGLASARSSHSRFVVTKKPWNLQVPHEQPDSIASFIANLPRGGQYYDDDNYGEDERYEDYRGYDDQGRAPSVGFLVVAS
jgi:hypothetical protein